jgi:hypothetical protein
MAIVYTTAVRNDRLNVVTTDIGNTGVLEIGTVGMATVLATVNLATLAANSAIGGVLTFNGFPRSANAANTGIANNARIRTNTSPLGVDIITGLTVSTIGSDVVLDSTNITAGQTVTINSMVINHA